MEEPPIRIGFFLEDEGARPYLWPELNYRGVDRLPSPDWSFFEMPAAVTPERSAWMRYFADDDGTLRRDYEVARTLQSDFARVEVALDVIFVEVAYLPDPGSVAGLPAKEIDDLRRDLMRSSTGIPGPPDEFELLGWDLSSPIPTFHSAIKQRVAERFPEMRSNLNSYGLVDEIDHAMRFAARLNTAPHIRPYCALAIYGQT